MKIVENYDIKKASFYRTGSIVKCIYFPQSLEELSSLLSRFYENNEPYFVIGSGSNLIISDSYYNGNVISLKHLDSCQKISTDKVQVEAGCLSTSLSLFAKKNNLSGTEWMYLLPGSIGGATCMNASCYGGSMDRIVSSVLYYDNKGKDHILENKDKKMFSGYKSSFFMDKDFIISSVILKLKEGNISDIDSLMKKVQIDRMSKYQFKYPSCGCVFKNSSRIYEEDITVDYPSSFILDKLGLKGKRINSVFVSPYHANFIFNNKGNSSDILKLAFLMQDTVYDKLGIWLEFEVKIVGNFSKEILDRFYLKKEFDIDKFLKNKNILST